MPEKFVGQEIEKQTEKQFQMKGNEGDGTTGDLGWNSGLKKKHGWENCQILKKCLQMSGAGK